MSVVSNIIVEKRDWLFTVPNDEKNSPIKKAHKIKHLMFMKYILIEEVDIDWLDGYVRSLKDLDVLNVT